ncbi:hypothetical protein HY993_00560 [Candidatus Micrarchaeota archaeon]|nr:hypothetical protein [Candidatus Micrarchaeota archaeon]
MVHHEVVEYIRQTRLQGFSDGQVRSSLIKAGWMPYHVDEAFAVAGKLPALGAASGKIFSRKPAAQKNLMIVEHHNAAPAAPMNSFYGFGWFDALILPTKTIRRESYRHSNKLTLANLVACTVLYLLVTIVFWSQSVEKSVLQSLALSASILVYSVISYLISSRLGRNANLRRQAYLTSFLSVPFAFLIPALMTYSFLTPLALLLGVYYVWLNFIAVRANGWINPLNATIASATALAIVCAANFGLFLAKFY